MPFALVGIALNWLRTSAGASGFRFERVEVARPAVEPNQDARFRLPGFRCVRAQPEQIGEAQPQCAKHADLQEIAARNSIAAARSKRVIGFHGVND
jgi:hypothetical protein